MAKIYLALGTNLGNREENLKNALELLKEKCRILKISSVYETEPFGYKDQPRFLNQALGGETRLSPLELLYFVKEAEKRLGRTKTFVNGPRVIDIDILLYDRLVLESEELTVPHPRFAERDFVLFPLSEIAGEEIHPVFGIKVDELKNQLPVNPGSVTRLSGDRIRG